MEYQQCFMITDKILREQDLIEYTKLSIIVQVADIYDNP